MQMMHISGPQEGLGKCSVCAKSEYDADRNQTFPTADSLYAHIATTHFYWQPFECVLCPMMFLPTEGVLKRHYERAHPNKVPKAIYTYVEEKKTEIGRIFLESQRFLDGNIVHNPDATTNPVDKPTTIQANEVAAEQPKRQAPQEICISDTEDGEEIAMEVEEEERLNMKRLAKEIFNQLQTGEDDHAVISEEDQRVTLNQAQPDNSLEEVESEESAWEIEKSKDNVSVNNNRKLVKQSSMKAKDVFPCNLCKDKNTTVTHTRKHAHIWSHHMARKRFSCKSCDYRTSSTSKMIDHSRHKHKRLSGINWIDHTTELQTDYHNRFVAAFGAMKRRRRITPLVQIQHTKARIQRSDCNLCSRSVSTTSRAPHIWGFHLKAKRYACLHCDYGSGQLGQMKQHATKHANMADKPCWKDNNLSLEYKKMLDAAFDKVRIKIPGKNNL